MIDYDKLKIAHTIASKIKGGLFISYFYSPDLLEFSFVSIDHDYYGTKNIDDAILKLTDLAKPKPKYSIGQTLWGFRAGYGSMEVICTRVLTRPESIIGGVTVEAYNEYKDQNLLCWKEDQLFLDLKSSIKAQIDYWQNLVDEADND